MSGIDVDFSYFQKQLRLRHVKAAIDYAKTFIRDQACIVDERSSEEFFFPLANALGRVESAQAERDLLMHVEEQLSTSAQVQESPALCEVRWRLTYHFLNMLRYDDALCWADRAIETAGLLVDVDWLAKTSHIKTSILFEIGGINDEVVGQHNSLIVMHNELWGRPDLVADYLFGEQMLSAPQFTVGITQLDDTFELNEIRQELYNRRNIPRKKIWELRQKLIEMCDAEDVLGLGECWRLVLQKDTRNTVLDDIDGQRLLTLLQKLLPLRANRLRIALINEALQKNIQNPILRTELHRSRLDLLRIRIENVSRVVYRTRLIQDYYQALSEALSSDMSFVATDLLFSTHYLKQLDLTENIQRENDEKTDLPYRLQDKEPTQLLEFLDEKYFLHLSSTHLILMFCTAGSVMRMLLFWIFLLVQQKVVRILPLSSLEM